MAASISASLLSFSLPRRFSLPIRHTLPRVSSSLSEFNITFAPPKPKPKPDPQTTLGASDEPSAASFFGAEGGNFFIPWIVRGDDGNLRVQSHPPAHLLHAMAHADTKGPPKKKQVKEKKAGGGASAPTRSKAARRFYNENFRESESDQRLSKVLAAAGGRFFSL